MGRQKTTSGVAQRVSTRFCFAKIFCRLIFVLQFATAGVPEERAGVLRFFLSKFLTGSNRWAGERVVVSSDPGKECELMDNRPGRPPLKRSGGLLLQKYFYAA